MEVNGECFINSILKMEPHFKLFKNKKSTTLHKITQATKQTKLTVLTTLATQVTQTTQIAMFRLNSY